MQKAPKIKHVLYYYCTNYSLNMVFYDYDFHVYVEA